VRLSATYNPIEYIVTQIDKWIPGADNIQAIYNKDNKLLFHDGTSAIQLKATNSKGIQLLKLRERKIRFTWLDVNLFTEETTLLTQLNIEKEIDNRLLALFFTNPIDQASDVLLIYFPEQANPYKLKNSLIGLTTDEKEQAGAILSTVLQTEYNRILNESQLMREFSYGISSMKTEIESLKQELSQLKSEIQNNFDSLLDSVKQTIEDENNVEMTFSVDARQKLKDLNLSEKELSTTLERAFNLEMVTQFTSSIVVISTNFIEKPTKNPSNIDKQSKYDRTMLLLNRYEFAAQELLNENQIINGKSIASKLEVSPPALTDAVKKNTTKIQILLENYPEKWEAIRKYLKPIQRIVDNFEKRA
jgi:hypothetical protein